MAGHGVGVNGGHTSGHTDGVNLVRMESVVRV
jgi:hypothetical protein